LDDAIKDDVHFVCTWFEQRKDGTLLLGSVRDLNRYSARSCLGTVDLKLVESESPTESGSIYLFADPSCEAKLLVALHTLENPVRNSETSAEADSRRRVNEEARAKADADAVQPTREHVSRGPGKRSATALTRN